MIKVGKYSLNIIHCTVRHSKKQQLPIIFTRLIHDTSQHNTTQHTIASQPIHHSPTPQLTSVVEDVQVTPASKQQQRVGRDHGDITQEYLRGAYLITTSITQIHPHMILSCISQGVDSILVSIVNIYTCQDISLSFLQQPSKQHPPTLPHHPKRAYLAGVHKPGHAVVQ